MATSCTEEDDVPPLEDFSGLIGQLKTLNYVEEKGDQESQEVPLGREQEFQDDTIGDIPERNCGETEFEKNDFKNKTVTASGCTAKAGESKKQCCKSSGTTFGGFQKGFLNKKKTNSNQSKKSIAKSDSSEKEEISTIRPKESGSNDLRIPEVQEAMKTPSLLDNKDWITDDLLKKIEARPDLLKKLADPRYSQALSQFRSNPQQAWTLIQDNEELQIFVKEFCGILGEHFTTMADQVDQNKSKIDGKPSTGSKVSNADEEKMAEILSDPATMEVLKDPWISKLVTNLKENPLEARRMLARSKPEVLPKIKKLIDAGILTYG